MKYKCGNCKAEFGERERICEDWKVIGKSLICPECKHYLVLAYINPKVEKFLNISFAIFGLLWVFGVFLTQFYEENMLLNKLVSAFFLCGFFSAIYYKLYSLRYIMSAKPTISLGVSKM